MTEATTNPSTSDRPAQPPALIAGSSVMAIIPRSVEEVYRLASGVIKASMAPSSLKTADACAVAILHGLEVGLSPMQALQSIAVINGKPTIWGDGALGLVRGSGLMEWMKETTDGGPLWIEGEDGKPAPNPNHTAVFTAQRKGEPEPIERRFSVADAMTAKLWGKRGASGQDTPWITFPGRMLGMRARSWGLRDGWADVLKGLQIREEVEDYGAPLNLTPDGPVGLAERLKPVGEGFTGAALDIQGYADGVVVVDGVVRNVDSLFKGHPTPEDLIAEGRSEPDPDITLETLSKLAREEAPGDPQADKALAEVDIIDWALSFVRGVEALTTAQEIDEARAKAKSSGLWDRLVAENNNMAREVAGKVAAHRAAVIIEEAKAVGQAES